MKNNILFFFATIFIFLLNISNAYSDDFIFESSEIEFLENGNLVKAKNGAKALTNDGIIINSNEFEYDKIKNIFVATGNVEIFDSANKLKLNAKKIFYYRNKEIIKTNSKTIVLVQNKYTVNTENIIFNRKKMEIISEYRTNIIDNLGNSFFLDSFKYWLNEKSLKGNKVKLITNTKDEFLFQDAMINLGTSEIAGKDIIVNFNNTTFGNDNNQPRLKGNTVYSNKENTKISKGVFTTCKKRDGCPPWQISAESIDHNKSKKIINYKNAWLKIYDKPVFYFPKFFHPDPTVKRQSGFLMPQLTSSNNLGTSVTIPYYSAISDNKDLTFSPRLYSNLEYLLQSEYRTVTKNSSHVVDVSFNDGHDTGVANDKSNSKTHFFSKSVYNVGLSGFDASTINLKIQKTTNNDYLKSYKLKSPLIESDSSLASLLNFEASRDDLSIKSSLEVYENLSITKPSDKYEFVFPNINILKKFKKSESLNGDLTLDASGHQRQFDTNVEETVLINNLLFKSNPLIQKSGLKNNYSLLLKNVNSDSKNSSSYRNSNSHKILSTVLFESSFPLKKEKDNYNSYLTPKVSMRYSPNPTKNLNNLDRKIDVSNVFSLDRIAVSDAVEGGQSLTIGSEYKKTNKNNDEILSLNLATVYRDKVNSDLPKTSTMNEKYSDIFGNLKISPNNFLNFDYKFSLDNNLDTTNYNFINSEFTINNFVTSFEFMEESNLIGNESYISNKTSYNFNKNNSLGFSTRKNKKTNLTEFYNLIYEYKNDCLVAGIEYKKEYYSTGSMRPEEQLFFTITIMPFGQTNSPNIKK